MNKKEVRKMTRNLGVTGASKLQTRELVNEIQKAEGNNPCFKTDVVNCCQIGCLWRVECQDAHYKS